MKPAVKFPGAITLVTALIILGAVLVLCGCGKKGPEFVQDPEIRAQLKSFAVEKESQARALASAEGKELPSKAKGFFSAIENANWEDATNDYAEMRSRIGSDKAFYGSWWQPVLETFGAAEEFTLGNEKYSTAYGKGIIQSIPPGSVYFGGTDPGRFIVTAMQESQVDGDPFFTVSQNPLADANYLDYLRSIYGGKIYIPTTNDWQKCFDEYFQDFQERQARHQLLPGEHVTNGPDGKMQVNSYMSVIQVRALVARMVFDENTNREFYLEESFPLEWMYPYLEPHGLIFKLNHQPLAQLSDDAVERDHDYWSKTVSPMIGDWLENDTSVSDVAAFNEKIFLQHDFNRFTGDTNFVLNSYAQRMFSKERSSIAGLYAWRAQHANNAFEKDRMARAADFAFRQSWALCPYSPEVVFRYVQFLMEEQRTPDALLIAETGAKFSGTDAASNGQLKALVTQLKQRQIR